MANKKTNKPGLDIENLTLGEVAKIEDLSGASISELGEDTTPKGKMLAAMAMVAKRRAGDMTFRFTDALKLPLKEAQELIGLDMADEAPEVKAAAKKD